MRQDAGPRALGAMVAAAALAFALILPTEAYSQIPGSSRGYLDLAALTRLASAIGPAPISGSAKDLADKAASVQYRSLEDTERWILATTHSELRPPLGLQHFDCTLGFRLSTAEAPRLAQIMNRLLHDAEGLAEQVKARVQRPRPVSDDPTRRSCQRLTDTGRKSSSYPSGSAAVAVAYGEILSDLVPEARPALLQTAHQVALSRSVCGMHYPHDVSVGEDLGRAVHQAARLNPDYADDLAAAKQEVQAARTLGQTSPACAAERSALAIALP